MPVTARSRSQAVCIAVHTALGDCRRATVDDRWHGPCAWTPRHAGQHGWRTDEAILGSLFDVQTELGARLPKTSRLAHGSQRCGAVATGHTLGADDKRNLPSLRGCGGLARIAPPRATDRDPLNPPAPWTPATTSADLTARGRADGGGRFGGGPHGGDGWRRGAAVTSPGPSSPCERGVVAAFGPGFAGSCRAPSGEAQESNEQRGSATNQRCDGLPSGTRPRSRAGDAGERQGGKASR